MYLLDIDLLEFIFTPIIIILDLIALYDILTTRRSAVSKVLWVIVILLMPVLGLIVYYIFGKRNFFKKLRQYLLF